MNIKIKDKNGIKLKTKGKFVEEDINITVDESLLGDNGTPIEVATVEEMDAQLVEENIGKIYKYVGETSDVYTNGELYQVIEEA